MLCAIYTRLSKEDEDKQQPESESIQNQKSLLIHYAVERGWDIYHIYSDEDYSGADALRPDFKRMLAEAKAGKFQIILCKSQARFTRDMELVEKYIHGLFPIWGIRFIALADNADTEVRGNKKARQINGLVNEWYLEDLSENIRMVFDMKRREGQYIGGGPVYGYRRHPTDKHKIEVDPEAAQVVAQIFRWALEGRGKQEIAHMLNDRGIPNPTRYKQDRGWTFRTATQQVYGVWNKTTVWRILHNEMYAGVMVQGRRRKASYKSKVILAVPKEEWFRVEGTHEAIIDRATFEAVQQALAHRSRSDGRGNIHVLSGLVRCMDCGSSLIRSSRSRGGKRISYLRCRLYAESGKGKLCTRHGIRLDTLAELVTGRVRHYVHTYFDAEQFNIQPQGNARQEALASEHKALTLQLEKRSLALKTLYLDKVSGVITEGQFEELNQSFLQERAQYIPRLKRLEQELARQDKPQDRDELMHRAKELLKLETLPRELAVLLIEKIEVGEKDPTTGRQEIRITWKF